VSKSKIVSIVTPCYNAEKYLDTYFESVLSQTYKNLELIIVNDGSTDNSDLIIRSYEEKLRKTGITLKYIAYQENKGQAYALNLGLKEVSGEYLTWPDIDDEMTDDCIEEKVLFLENNLECDYCICNAISIDEEKNEKIVYRPQILTDRKAITESLIFSEKGYFVCGAYMVRSSFFDKVVTDREIYTGRGGQNAQMLIPTCWYGKHGYIDKELYRFYIHKNSHSHSIDDPKKHIRQLSYFQDIVINTLEKTNDSELMKYIPEVKKHYSRLRFGHSLDSKDGKIIKDCAREMKELGILNLHDRYLVFRYTNRLSRILFPV